MKKIDEFPPDRRQNLAESDDKGSWFNQLAESEAASASSLDVSAVSKKKYWKAEESNVTRERLPRTSPDYSVFVVGFFIVRNECLLETTLRYLLFGLFLFCVRQYIFPFVLSFVDHG